MKCLTLLPLCSIKVELEIIAIIMKIIVNQPETKLEIVKIQTAPDTVLIIPQQ